jgi:lysyl-tRNA synthetase, class II
MSRIDETIQAKKEKRAQLEASGVVVHPPFFDKKQTIAQTREMIDQSVKTAGRIVALRTHGKVVFVDLKDTTGQIQVMIRQQEVGDELFARINLIDNGDFLGVSGNVMTSKTGEITILAAEYQFLGKTLRPLPTGWNAAEDKEARFRKRYLDMLVNPQVKWVLDARWTIVKEVRRYLQDQHQFVEVETPILQTLYGGTNAKPFTTHMNALDSDFYLRVAPELYLKRLIVGGYDRIFEIARNFRNEGIDQTHQPEFTMIEWYQTYADYNIMMDVAEGMIKHLVEKVHASSTIMIGDRSIDVSGQWPRMTMKDALKEFAAIEFDTSSDDELKSLMSKNNIEIIGEFTRGKAQFALFDKLVTDQLIQPTWITNYPRDVSPLAKKHREFPELAERFEAYIGGKELADGWSEITDAIDQRSIFENEQKRMRAGDSEAHPLDEEFLEAMEYGMPPLGGIGMGIDRLVMFLTNTWSIREVIAFPTLRRAAGAAPTSKQPDMAKAAPVAAPATTTAVTQSVDISPADDLPLPPRSAAEELLTTYIKNEKLQHHCRMVARAMEAYARELGADTELWYQAGLLHDLDWEMYPDEHPNRALNELLTEYPASLRAAIAAHAPERTGHHPQTAIENHLFACDELSGFMHALSLMRPNGFADMEVKSVTKRLKDKAFASNVSREDISQGATLIGKPLEEHIAFLIEVFKNQS